MSNDFYVGYLPLPQHHRRFLIVLLPVIGLLAVLVSFILSSQQSDPGDGNWDLASTTTLTGRVTVDPYPILSVPGSEGAPERQILLITMGKVGGDGFTQPVAGEWITVTGYLIARDGRTMLTVEHAPTDIAVAPNSPAREPRRTISLGRHRLRGEIIDPKCYFGAMKPGEGKVHKACATLCIAGGIPPMFVTRSEAGERTYYLLTDSEGNGLRGDALEALLPFVADPVRIEGEVDRWGDLLVCRMDPGSVVRE